MRRWLCRLEEDGKREKLPIYTFKSGATYEGEWLNGVRDGDGLHIWPDGAKYEGIIKIERTLI